MVAFLLQMIQAGPSIFLIGSDFLAQGAKGLFICCPSVRSTLLLDVMSENDMSHQSESRGAVVTHSAHAI